MVIIGVEVKSIMSPLVCLQTERVKKKSAETEQDEIYSGETIASSLVYFALACLLLPDGPPPTGRAARQPTEPRTTGRPRLRATVRWRAVGGVPRGSLGKKTREKKQT